MLESIILLSDYYMWVILPLHVNSVTNEKLSI